MESAAKPDFTAGVPFERIPDGGMLQGTVGDEDVVLTRRGNECFAVGAYCSHYHGPLAQGLIVGDTVRCPLHHACFSLRTGAALRAPAFDPIACWRIEHIDGTVFVREKRADSAAVEPASSAAEPRASPPPPNCAATGFKAPFA
jgi:nitrite reductase/ring-hydroxylating ferredoxin subunit